MSEMPIDEASIAVKELAITERTPLLIIGAGPAGIAAAMAASRRGIAAMLVDENPVPFETMGEEVPLHFGQRMTGATRNRNAMMEAVLEADPALSEAFEAGVDIRLGTVVWGLYAPMPTAGWIPGTVAALADHERSWIVGAENVIVAAGRRDMGLAFPGWELPGVMGAVAAERLATTYDALAARRAVVLGTSTETMLAVAAMRHAGVAIAAIVERADRVLDQAAEGALTGHVVARAEGDADGIRAVVVAAVDADGRHVPGSEQRFECDTLVLGVGTVPAIELLEAMGARVAFDPARGGHVPVVDAGQQTTRPGIYAIGDCAGIWPGKSRDTAVVRAEAEAAVAAIAADASVPSVQPDEPAVDLAAYRCGWVRASVVEAAGEPYVCQCEEVTAREILEVRPPRYLGWTPPTQKPADLRSLLGAGPPHPDQVKRLTRAGMGACQGRRCREQVAALLALGASEPLDQVPLASFRAPVRPLPLARLDLGADPVTVGRGWDSWFGMAPQWVPFWKVPSHYTASGREADGEPVASE
jgi:thioredoxin reductase